MKSIRVCLFAILVMYMLSGFAVAAPDPAIADDAVNMVLSGGYNGTRFSWELKYGLARQHSLEFLAKGDKEKALQAAKMQFILCPPDAKSIEAVIAGVKQMLVAVDGNDARAKEFESYATLGPAGADGKLGTADDLKDPVKDVVPLGIPRDKAFYADYDRAIDERIAFGEPWAKSWYETQKAFARLDAGDFPAAARILVSALAAEIAVPRSRVDDWPLLRAQDIYERINVGLAAVYRARTDTTAGAAEFVRSCEEYAKFGPPGKDGAMGTPDDLEPPM